MNPAASEQHVPTPSESNFTKICTMQHWPATGYWYTL